MMAFTGVRPSGNRQRAGKHLRSLREFIAELD